MEKLFLLFGIMGSASVNATYADDFCNCDPGTYQIIYYKDKETGECMQQYCSWGNCTPVIHPKPQPMDTGMIATMKADDKNCETATLETFAWSQESCSYRCQNDLKDRHLSSDPKGVRCCKLAESACLLENLDLISCK